MNETHNGWRNVETWRVQLHLANDEHEAKTTAAMAAIYAGGFQGWPDERRAAVPERFADWLRGYVEERAGVTDTGGSTFAMFARDVVEAALHRVDWDQLARHWMDAAEVKA